MAPVTTELKVLVKAIGKGELKELEASLQKLAVTARTKVDTNFKQVSLELKKVQKTSAQSISNLRGYRNAWRDIAEQVDVTSREFQVATRNAEKLDQQLRKVQQRKAPGGRIGGFAGAARGVGAIAAGGVFGGVEGALGGGIGLLAGGPAGAAVGAAIGAQLGGFRQAIGGTAEYSAQLGKLRIALQGVTTSQEEYQQALGFVQRATEDYAVPQDVLTRQFTKLQASVQGAGGNLNDTKTAFNGIVAAVRATGGSLADVDAALTATAQVFSKGKVSAEELRQQIGERLPGAFTLFAESIGMTPQELDKALEKGQVSLQDFQTFAEALFKRYGETAQKIADDPKSAGDRLQVELQKLQESIGQIVEPIGALFQAMALAIVKSLNQAIGKIREFAGYLGGLRNVAKLLTQGAIGALLPGPLGFFAGQAIGRQIEQIQVGGVVGDIAQPQTGTGLPGIDPATGKGKRDTAAERALRAYNKALEDAAKLATDLTRKTRDVQLQLENIGVSAKEAIQIKWQQAFNKAADIAEDLGKKVADLQAATGLAFEDLTQLANEYLRALKDVADAQRDAALFALRLSELGMSPEQFQSMELAFAGGAGGMGFGEGMQVSLLQQQSDAIDELLKKYPQLGQAAEAAADVMSFGFRDVVFGVKSAQEVFSEFLKGIADMLFETAKQMIAQYIALAIARMFAFGGSGGGLSGGLGGLPGTSNVPFIGSMPFPMLADGGPASANKPYIVGERGPELFVPGQSGSVINNNQLSSAMSRYRRSGTTATNETTAAMQGGEGSTAVMDKPIDVRYTVDRINSVDYVTAEQFQQGMRQAAQQGAKQGEQRTLARIQNASSVRRRIGI